MTSEAKEDIIHLFIMFMVLIGFIGGSIAIYEFVIRDLLPRDAVQLPIDTKSIDKGNSSNNGKGE